MTRKKPSFYQWLRSHLNKPDLTKAWREFYPFTEMFTTLILGAILCLQIVIYIHPIIGLIVFALTFILMFIRFSYNLEYS